MLRGPSFAVAGILVTSIAGISWPMLAQNAASIWAGAYTAAQAARGRVVVEDHCGECHREDLSGGEAPALTGPTFMLKWETHSVERLFHKIRDTMPSRESTDVTGSEKLDAVAYILQQNGFPAGSTELTDTSTVLASLRIVPKDGPSAPRAGALVQAVGCLEETAANRWTLAGSTDPQVTTLDPMSAAGKRELAAAHPGAQTVELLSVFPSPVALVRHRVLVKGLLIKTATATRINVTSLESLAPDCYK